MKTYDKDVAIIECIILQEILLIGLFIICKELELLSSP